MIQQKVVNNDCKLQVCCACVRVHYLVRGTEPVNPWSRTVLRTHTRRPPSASSSRPSHLLQTLMVSTDTALILVSIILIWLYEGFYNVFVTLNKHFVLKPALYTLWFILTSVEATTDKMAAPPLVGGLVSSDFFHLWTSA